MQVVKVSLNGGAGLLPRDLVEVAHRKVTFLEHLYPQIVAQDEVVDQVVLFIVVVFEFDDLFIFKFPALLRDNPLESSLSFSCQPGLLVSSTLGCIAYFLHIPMGPLPKVLSTASALVNLRFFFS